MDSITRREFLGALGMAGLGATLGVGEAWARPAPLMPFAALKPGGHRSAGHYCKSTFVLEGRGPIALDFGGTGYAAFNNGLELTDALRRSVVSMDWETNQCFTRHPELGVVAAIARVRGKYDALSGMAPMASNVVLQSERGGAAFPATMVNQLYFDVEIPSLGLRICNMEPMVLQGRVDNLWSTLNSRAGRTRLQQAGVPAQVLEDVRQTFVAREGRPFVRSGGVPRGLEVTGFEPLGVHTLQAEVPFVSVEDHERVQAVLTSTSITVLPHYGLEITLTGSRVDGAVVHTEWRIDNLLPRPQEIIWYADDSYDLQVVSDRRSEPITIGAEPVTFSVQAVNRRPDRPLDRESCIFCGCSSITPGIESFTSFLNMIDGEFLTRQATGGQPGAGA